MCFEPPGLCGALRRTSAMASSISLSLAFRKVLAAAPIMKNNDSQHEGDVIIHRNIQIPRPYI